MGRCRPDAGGSLVLRQAPEPIGTGEHRIAEPPQPPALSIGQKQGRRQRTKVQDQRADFAAGVSARLRHGRLLAISRSLRLAASEAGHCIAR